MADKNEKAKNPKVTKEDIKKVVVTPESVIFLTKDFKGRPRREGSKAYKIFNFYKDGDTVAEFLTKSKAAGGTLRNVRKDTAYGRISLKPGTAKAA